MSSSALASLSLRIEKLIENEVKNKLKVADSLCRLIPTDKKDLSQLINE